MFICAPLEHAPAISFLLPFGSHDDDEDDGSRQNFTKQGDVTTVTSAQYHNSSNNHTTITARTNQTQIHQQQNKKEKCRSKSFFVKQSNESKASFVSVLCVYCRELLGFAIHPILPLHRHIFTRARIRSSLSPPFAHLFCSVLYLFWRFFTFWWVAEPSLLQIPAKILAVVTPVKSKSVMYSRPLPVRNVDMYAASYAATSAVQRSSST